MVVPETACTYPAYAPERLVNHWAELAGWPPDRELWSFYITLAGHRQLHRVVDHYQQLLRPFCELDLVEHANLHITLQGIRFVDETDDATIDLLADAVGRRLSAMDLPELSTAHPETDTDAVQLPILPRDSVVQLREAIQSTIESELGGDFLYRLPEPRNGFDPHVTIAYANQGIDNRAIYAVLHAAPAPRASFRVEHASLIKLRRRTRRWSWEGERALAIGVR